MITEFNQTFYLAKRGSEIDKQDMLRKTSDNAGKSASQRELGNVPYLVVILGHSHKMNEILKV